MKFGTTIAIGALALAFTITSCGPENESCNPVSTEGYSKVIMYSVDQNNAYFEDLDDEDFSEFAAMGQQLIQDVLDGKLKAYHPFDPDVEMTAEELNAQLFVTDTFSFIDTTTYEEVLATVEHDYTKDVQSLKFKERWNYEPGTGVIDKVPVAIAPRKAVIDYEGQTIRGYTPLFWVKLE